MNVNNVALPLTDVRLMTGFQQPLRDQVRLRMAGFVDMQYFQPYPLPSIYIVHSTIQYMLNEKRCTFS